ncbi:hypothetical protein KSF_036610 [Reticulibacter mediterranei]|uniref:FAD/NAD(P)-binding domain-containing protein n=1 Tax=Reticulibacter mediterranei TaxID=2778369 RepID=A0A8J3IJI6_9CHLR|nr:hypothetical protein [Reticulibacter mediterranei]GHO93613.1 hypothetical protein KSF_036610 [Reticulibacter mediterranei]
MGTLSELKRIIEGYSGIADVSELLKKLLDNISGPDFVVWQQSTRQEHLQIFAQFFEQIGVNDTPQPTPRPLPAGFDRRFNDPADPIAPIFERIFGDARLLRRWMKQLDEHIERTSNLKLDEIDLAARSGQRPVRKSIVIIGGGPLTCLVASILAPFHRVTVITDQRRIGGDWRNSPFWINSSCAISDFSAPALPTQGGPTTHVVNSRQVYLNVDLLLKGETKTVTCDDGSTVQYVPGTALGDLIATNMVLDIDECLLGQRVDFSRLRRTQDGLLVEMVDASDGTRRTLLADTVICLTGPGREQTKIADTKTRQLHGRVARELDEDLLMVRGQLAPLRKERRQLEGVPTTPRVRKRLQEIRREMAQIAKKVRPQRVWTLTAIQKLYELWSYDLDYDPGAYPFTDILYAESIGFIGDGNTMCVAKEIIDGTAPSCAYRNGSSPAGRPRATLYNVQASTPEKFNEQNRRRYANVFTPGTRSIPDKATWYELQETSVEIVHYDADGLLRRNTFGFLFDATGLDRKPPESLLYRGLFDMVDVKDLESNVVARGDTKAGLYIAGSAADLEISQLPGDLQAIFRELKLSDNTISLWLNGLLVERMVLSIAATRPPTRRRPLTGNRY